VQSTPTATPEPNAEIFDGLAALQESLRDLAASQGRLVATVVLLALLVFSIVVVPAALSWLRTRGVGEVESGHTGRLLSVAVRYTPTTVRGMLLRMSQLAVLAVVVISFLVVWGVVDIVAAVGPYLRGNDATLVPTLQTVVLIMLAFVVSDQLKRWTTRVSTALDDFTEHQQEILLRVGQVAVFVTVGTAIFAVWNVDISGLLVGAGFLGIVVGLAARQTLGSLIAGFVLMFSRPFTIGDWVVIGDQEGVVTDITIFTTRLENFDGEFVVMPNDKVSDRAITNRSRKGLLRLTLDIGVDYDTDVERAREIAREAMVGVADVIDSPPPQVVPKSFGDSAVVLELRFWIDHPAPPRKWRAVSAVVRAVKTAFDGEEIGIPFPQRTLNVREESADGDLLEGIQGEPPAE